MNKPKVKDAGEKIPYAKKHAFAKSKHKDKRIRVNDLTKKSLWPTPDWKAMIAEGRELKAVIHMAVMYEGFRNYPRNHFGTISYQQWEIAFEKSIKALKSIFAETRTYEDAKQINNKLNKYFGICKNDYKDNNLNVIYHNYALGHGGRRQISGTTTLSPRQRALIKWLEFLQWPDNKNAMKAKVFPLEFQDGDWALAKYNAKSYSYRDEHVYKDKASCLSAFAEMYIDKTGKPKPYNPNKPKFELDRVEVYKKGITGDDLINDFGFRGIQFGRYLSNKERQLWLDQVYHAFTVFSEIMNIPNKRWIGLGGLGLAFGARGSGQAVAHYEKELRTINISKSRGPGAIIHEWWHALDHHLMKKLKIPNKTVQIQDYCTQLLADYSLQEIKAENVASHYKILRELFDTRYPYKLKSEFISQARKLSMQYGGGRYWSRTIEVYARSFEAYVQDKLIKLNIDSPWLSFGTLQSDYASDKLDKCPYPIGAERIRLFDIWERFTQCIWGSAK